MTCDKISGYLVLSRIQPGSILKRNVTAEPGICHGVIRVLNSLPLCGSKRVGREWRDVIVCLTMTLFHLQMLCSIE
jgi:hypothetical protein